PEDDRAVEVEPSRGVPAPAEPATARRLPLRDHDRPFGRARPRPVARHPLRRIGLLVPLDLPPRATQMRGELGGAQTIRHGAQRIAPGPSSVDAVPQLPERRDPLPHGGARAAETARQLLARERARGHAQPADDPLIYRHAWAHASGSIFRCRSAAGAECVIAPSATNATPVAATSGRSSGWTPPETSRGMRPPTSWTAAQMSASVMLSMRIRSGAAPSAASISARFLHSTSSGSVGQAARAARTAAPTSPPQSARWLSLIRIASSSARRWFVPPPVRTAYLARRRKPGSVFRVSRTTSCV